MCLLNGARALEAAKEAQGIAFAVHLLSAVFAVSVVSAVSAVSCCDLRSAAISLLYRYCICCVCCICSRHAYSAVSAVLVHSCCIAAVFRYTVSAVSPGLCVTTTRTD